MRPVRAAVIASVSLFVCGCGSEAEPERAASKASATPTASATQEATPTVDPFSDQAAADLATAYVQAIVNAEWKDACAMHARRWRRLLARSADSCAAGIADFWTANRRVLGDLEQAGAGEVRRRGGRAIVQYSQTFAPKLGLDFVAVREGGRWRLADFEPLTAE